MPVPDAPEQEAPARFQSWRGFLAASIAVNVLFVYGMLGGMNDASVSTWYKALIWLPFNVIATAVYLAIMARLAGRGVFYRILCGVLIVANWVVLLRV
jgi:predicted nucleic acid-binding protein